MTVAIIIIAVVLVAAVATWWFGREKKSQPTVYLGGGSNTAGNGSGNQNTSLKIDERPVFHVTELSYILQEFKKNGVYYEAPYKANSMLYATVTADKLDRVAYAVDKHTTASYPMIQFGFSCTSGSETGLVYAEPSNGSHQHVTMMKVTEGDVFYLSSEILSCMTQAEYVSILLSYRINNGNGWCAWEPVDSVNIHYTK